MVDYLMKLSAILILVVRMKQEGFDKDLRAKYELLRRSHVRGPQQIYRGEFTAW